MKRGLQDDIGRHHRDNAPGLLTGVRSICHYTRWGHQTFYKLQKDHGLPAMQLPDGRWCTSKTLIDEWILGRVKGAKGDGDDRAFGDWAIGIGGRKLQ